MPVFQFRIDWPDLIARNVAKVKDELEGRQIDLLFVNNTDNVRYLTGYGPVFGIGLANTSWAVVGPRLNEGILYGFNFYVDSIRERFPWIVDVRPLPDDMPRAIADLVAEVGASRGRLGVDKALSFAVGTE